MRVSIDGMGQVDEYVRQGTDFSHKLAVMHQYHKHFNIECWDITVNSLSVRVVHRLIQYLKAEFPDTQINIRPAYGNSPLHLWRLPSGFRHNILDWFKKHKDLAWGSDHIISELQKPYKPYNEKIKQVVDFWDNRGSVKLEDFDPELARYIHG